MQSYRTQLRGAPDTARTPERVPAWTQTVQGTEDRSRSKRNVPVLLARVVPTIVPVLEVRRIVTVDPAGAPEPRTSSSPSSHSAREIVSVALGAVTVTVLLAVAVAPCESRTVKVVVKLPAELNVTGEGLATVALDGVAPLNVQP